MKERELLEALARHGEISPALAALETSLTVAEANRMLSDLANSGHVEVRVRGGRLGYALWERDRRELTDGA
jgi:DNA-binding IclR family transcriptional regulator